MARNVNVNWVYPTTRVSGKPLDPAQIAGMELSLSVDNVNWTVFDTYTGDVTSTVVTELDIGDWYFKGVVIDTAGKRSTPVIATVKVPDETPPGPLSSLTVSLV